MEDSSQICVSELYVYPIKSCKGIAVRSAAICSTGFRWDRQWMVVNDRGRMLTQRVVPKLALVEPVLPAEYFTLPLSLLPPNASLGLKAPGMKVLQVPLFADKEHKEKVNVSVWNWSGVALDEGSEAGNWFSEYLGRTCQFVRHQEGVTTRLADEKYADGYQTSFADGFPFLVSSQASLDAVNKRVSAEKVLVNRFRPNIVASGCAEFAEDLWRDFMIDDMEFIGVKSCARCKMTTIVQETGESGVEPTPALDSFRRGVLLCNNRAAEKQVFFGQNAVCKSPNPHEIGLGDRIRVIQTMESLIV